MRVVAGRETTALAWPLACALALTLGCGAPVKPPASSPDTGLDADVNADGASVGSDATGDAAGDAAGTVGAPCESATECDSALCLQTRDGGRCSAYCGDGQCQPGWSCQGLSGGGDGTHFCIPDAGLLCRPCASHEVCRASGHGAAACVDYGDVGAFCGLPCATNASCPPGSVCRDVQGIDAGPVKQCVQPGAGPGGLGVCACPPVSQAEAHGTACWLVDGAGASQRRCKGSRVCGSAGLGACTALKGNEAQCLDVQCLDALTGLPLPDGKGCDDGRACTVGDACKAGTCTSGAQLCDCEPGLLACPAPTAAEASNLCRGAPICVPTSDAEKPYTCQLSPGQTKVCDGSLDGACVKSACAPSSGDCAMTPVEETALLCDVATATGGAPTCRREVLPAGAPKGTAAACDDGLACSSGDVCAGGVCAATDVGACKCKVNADCVDDGDLCNGTPICDKSGATWTCKINPATVVSCDVSGDGPCDKTMCTPSTGVCAQVDLPEGATCSDGVACTAGDVCNGKGTCQPGTWTCCKVDADCAKEEDGNACNGTLFCNKAAGACQLNPATLVTCPSVDDTACAKAACEPKTGGCALKAVKPGEACDDGDVCTDGEICAAGACGGGADVCSCATDADCQGKDDGDLCNGTLYCNKAIGKCKLNPATAVSCPTVDDTACRRNRCQPKSGQCALVDLPAAATCDADGTGCTANDACDGKGGCQAGTLVCVCANDADCAPFEDGDVCNGALYCDKSGAAPACKVNAKSVISCPSVDDTACQKNTCQKKLGTCAVVKLAAGSVCSDGQPCTGGDACDGLGGCVAGKVAVCGCKADADCKAFDDGDVCNGAFACGGGACQAVPAIGGCGDGEPCTDDGCDKLKGCVHLANSVTCTDGDACTTGDACKGGACAAAGAVGCDDGNPCSDDACDKTKGCVHLPNSATCTDGDVCLVGEACVGGSCSKPLKGLDCEDGNSCTDDSCDKVKGCLHIANGKLCSDGDVCTTGEVCKAGACDAKTSTPTACGDGESCTVDACDAVKGCSYALVADGAGCAGQAAGACLGGVCKPSGCGLGLRAVVIDDGGKKVFACEATGPVWGKRPISPVGVYSFGAAVGGQKVVKDAQTGLEWDPSASVQKAWQDAVAYCDSRVYAGKADWRLPSVMELASLVDYGMLFEGSAAAVDQAHFSLMQAVDHWTSSLLAGFADKAIVVGFGAGDIGLAAQGGVHHVRCVRGGGAPATISRYTVHPSGKSVLDRWTNLRWQRTPTQATWSEGVSACAALTLDGSGPYRLPTVRELHGLFDSTLTLPFIDAVAFPAAPVDNMWYWSGSSFVFNAGFAWRVEFQSGYVFNGVPKIGVQWVQCVADAPSCAKDADCDDGDPCTTGKCLPSGACDHLPASGAACTLTSGCPGLCASGACQPTGLPLPAATTMVLVDSTSLRSVSPDASGGAVLCASGYVDKTSTVYNWVRRLDDKAQLLWQQELGNKELGNSCAVAAVQPDDAVTALGVIGKIADNNRDVAFWRWDAKGNSLVKAKALGLGIAKGLSLLGHDVGGGMLALGGARTQDPGERGWAVIVDAAGAAMAFATLPSTATSAEIRAVSAIGTGFGFFGRAVTASGHDGVISHHVDAEGKVARWHWADDGLYAYAAAAAADGGWWLVVGPPGSHQLRRHGADGRLLFARALPAKISIVRARATAIGLLLAGQNSSDNKNAFVARLDASGAIVWQRLLPFPTSGTLADITWTGKEVWAVGSVSAAGGVSQAYQLRLDAWGRPPCSSGGCADAGSAACDDADPCTTDRCSSDDGTCSHAKMADATPCGTGKVCSAGTCLSACGNGQLDAGEACDDGGSKAGDGCSATCAFEAAADRVYVPRGAFAMGCNAVADKGCAADELPQHAVQLSAYWIDRYELTVERYMACVGAGACANKSAGTVAAGALTLPATHLNFADAENACAFVTPGGRLPTEAEWEKAARGGCALSPSADCAASARSWPWGHTAPDCSLATVAGCSGPLAVGSAPLGASPYGVLDMAGNVDEWVSDWYGAGYYGAAPGSDPKGPAKADNGNHVARGGSHGSNAASAHLRCAGRISHHPMVGAPSGAYLGVRCALDAAPCGDGKRDVGEDCDDGNDVGKDGCPGDCRLH